MKEVVIVSGKRTPIGSLQGSLSGMSAHKLGEVVIRGLIDESRIDPQDISEVIMGQVLTAGCGQNPARQASIAAGIPDSVTALTVNNVCGSGLQSVILAAQSIALGHANIIIAGGQESMSQSKHAIHMRSALKMGDVTLLDTMLTDGLTDAFSKVHMGITAENIASKYMINREEQDEFALHSQRKAALAYKNGKFIDEIIPVEIEKKDGKANFSNDEFIRLDITPEGLSRLKPAFKKDGTVTAGNSSGINDGAAAILLMSKEEALKRKLHPMAVIRSYASSGTHPDIMGIAPIDSSRRALHLANWNQTDLDFIEANEAFAAASICVNKEMGWDAKKVNVNGGAIALGHPIGASGARILVTLLYEMKRYGQSKGLATLCIGGGMGLSMCIERTHG